MAFNYQPVDWSDFPGVYDAVLAALPFAREITITPDEERERSPFPADWPPQPPGERFATVTVTVRIPLPA